MPGTATAAPLAQRPLPAFFEYAAPESWQAIDFISDLHLCERMPRTLQALARHLQASTADAVFILGDLFELWVGDDARQRPFERSCVEVLAEAASRRVIGLMVGNRDFLIGVDLLREAGAIGLPDPTVLSAWGQRLLLSHGDALCLGDTAYQAWRTQSRDVGWQQAFLTQPLAHRLEIAERLRRASQDRQRFDGAPDVDIDTAEAVRWLHALGAPQLVHGHTHRPGSNPLAPGFKRHVLSDWDLDGIEHEQPRAEVLRLSRDGLQRLAPQG